MTWLQDSSDIVVEGLQGVRLKRFKPGCVSSHDALACLNVVASRAASLIIGVHRNVECEHPIDTSSHFSIRGMITLAVRLRSGFDCVQMSQVLPWVLVVILLCFGLGQYSNNLVKQSNWTSNPMLQSADAAKTGVQHAADQGVGAANGGLQDAANLAFDAEEGLLTNVESVLTGTQQSAARVAEILISDVGDAGRRQAVHAQEAADGACRYAKQQAHEAAIGAKASCNQASASIEHQADRAHDAAAFTGTDPVNSFQLPRDHEIRDTLCDECLKSLLASLFRCKKARLSEDDVLPVLC